MNRLFESERPPEEWLKVNHELSLERERKALAAMAAAMKTAEAEFEADAVKAKIPVRVLDTLRAAQGDASILVTPAISELVQEWNKRLLVLAGHVGVGKSVAAGLWLLASERPWMWISAGALSRGYAYDQKAFSELATVPSLVIDDIGLEWMDTKERYLGVLEEIVTERHGNKLGTLITTNIVEVEVFRDRYQKRIADRIREDGRFVLCPGVSLRRRPA